MFDSGAGSSNEGEESIWAHHAHGEAKPAHEFPRSHPIEVAGSSPAVTQGPTSSTGDTTLKSEPQTGTKPTASAPTPGRPLCVNSSYKVGLSPLHGLPLPVAGKHCFALRVYAVAWMLRPVSVASWWQSLLR